MSAIQTLFRALFRSDGNEQEKYSDVQSRDKPEAFERSGGLFSGRGIICFGITDPRSADSRKSRILI